MEKSACQKAWEVRNKKIQKEEKVHCVQCKAAFMVIHRMFWKYTVSQVYNHKQQNRPSCVRFSWISVLNSGTTPLSKVRDGSKKHGKQILWHGFRSACNSLTLHDFVCTLRGKALPLSGTFDVYKRRSEEKALDPGGSWGHATESHVIGVFASLAARTRLRAITLTWRYMLVSIRCF